jgi:uridine kinase
MIIGFAGPSCSGKTTLARKTSEILNCPLVHMDQFCIHDAEKPIVNGYASYEQPHQYDHIATLKHLEDISSHNKDIIIEGFLLFSYPELYKKCDLHFFIDLDYEIQKERRLKRSSQKEYDGVWLTGHSNDADKGFLAHGKEEWEKYGAIQKTLKDIISLNGSDNSNHLMETIIKTIEEKKS